MITYDMYGRPQYVKILENHDISGILCDRKLELGILFIIQYFLFTNNGLFIPIIYYEKLVLENLIW